MLRFSGHEVKDLLMSLAAVSFIFTVYIAGLSISLGFLYGLVLSLVAAGTGFVIHEIAHKFAALKFGCWAEFRAETKMILISLAIAVFLRAVILAPGAVMIRGRMTRRISGVISAAGPLANLLLALGFLSFRDTALGNYGFEINSWLALFNLIPALPFDGFKVLRWSKGAYAALAASSAFLVFVL